MTQENIAEDESGNVTFYLSCDLGWSFSITNLKSVFESNYNPREKDQKKALESRAVTLPKDA